MDFRISFKTKKNDILQQLGIKNRDNLKEYHSKLKNYRYINDFIYFSSKIITAIKLF